MKISKLQITDEIQIETKTDALRILRNEADKRLFIRDFGDVEVVLRAGVYHVPAFSKERQKYIAWKTEQCDVWGSE